MGEIRKYRCSCGYEKNIYHGAGMGAINFRNAERLFPEEAARISEAREAGRETDFRLYNVMVLCPACREIDTVAGLDYSIGSDSERISTYIHKCHTCGGELSILPEEEVFCPKCGEDMSWEHGGLWD